MILVTKLISGEELISDTEIVSADGVPVVLLKKPCRIISVPVDGGISVQLMPWMHFAKDHTVPIGADMIQVQVEPNTELYNNYNAAFGTGIQIPNSSIQLG